MDVQITNQPKFEHDCDRCVFLGHALDADLYFCLSAPTVIARYSSWESDYISGMALVGFDIRLAAALGLAHQKNLVK